MTFQLHLEMENILRCISHHLETEVLVIKLMIEQAIEDLPEDLRTAFTLREFSGLSYEDITEVMDCPVGTVRSRIFRAREAIDKKIREAI